MKLINDDCLIAMANLSDNLKEISVEDMQKIVDVNEKLVKELKDGIK